MTGAQAARKAAKALDLHEQARNLAMELLRDGTVAMDRDRDFIDIDLDAAHRVFQQLRQLAEEQAQEAKQP